MSKSVKMYVLVGFVSLLLYYLANVCLNTAAERQIKRMRNILYKSIIRQDMAFFDKNTTGELSSIISSNIESLKYGINFKFSDFLTLLGRGVGCLIFSFVSAWKFSIVFMALLPFMILATAIMVAMIKKYTIKEFQAYGSAGRIAQEVLSSLRTVISFGLEKKCISK
jgi:ATP-binding cassette subfamily B (MDR/TAP) protein 1